MGDPTMEAIEVSAEMLTLIGCGLIGDRAWPSEPVAIILDERLAMTFLARPEPALLECADKGRRVLLVISRSACERLLGGPLELEDGTSYLLSADLRAIALALRDCAMPAATALPYRLAKSIELVCELLSAHRRGDLLPAEGATSLSFADCQRVAEARRLIDESWSEPLTLDRIAQRCGLNRSKLSRGFRELFLCSVNEAIVERRLAEARKALISTDLPVGLIGYRSGYLNNASFTRAFGRRFGQSPSHFRTMGAVA